MRVLILVLALFLAGCSSADRHNPNAVFDEPEAIPFTNLVVEAIKAGDLDAWVALSHPDVRDSEDNIQSLKAVLDYFPADPNLEITHYYSERRVGEGEHAGLPIYLTGHDVVGGGKTLQLLLAVAEHEGECCVATYVNITETICRPSTFHDFRFGDRGALHFIFLALLILVPLFIIVTMIACVRNPDVPGKWLWLIFIVCALWGLNFNWSTGEITNDLIAVGNGTFRFNLISIQLMGAGISSYGPFQPWIIEIGSPIGAIIYWICYGRRRAQTGVDDL